MANLVQSNVEGVRVVHLSGTLNQRGVDEIEPGFTAEARSGGPIVVDLAGVDIINTPGLAILLSAHREAQRAGGRMILTGVNTALCDLLHRCQLDRIFVVVPKPDEAIQQARA